RRLHEPGTRVLLRADSAFYGADVVHAARTGGADVSITVRLDPNVKKAIADIAPDGWTKITYPHPILDQDSGLWVSRAEVAEIGYTAFSSKKKTKQVTGRLVVRRIPDANAKKKAAGQDTLFDTWRFHAFFTTTDPADLDTVAADKTHRQHATIENVHADLKGSALAHLPSASFWANSAWLVLAAIAFNLTRAAATLTGQPRLAKATTATIRRKLIHIPARIATSARRRSLHLPTDWPWEKAWTQMFVQTCRPPPATART
ncbi:MAG: IS1380 family transposase, partial [Actinomycetota bacterium]|nr:IS1380 family transposase [Actinomycetota bacterium]